MLRPRHSHPGWEFKLGRTVIQNSLAAAISGVARNFFLEGGGSSFRYVYDRACVCMWVCIHTQAKLKNCGVGGMNSPSLATAVAAIFEGTKLVPRMIGFHTRRPCKEQVLSYASHSDRLVFTLDVKELSIWQLTSFVSQYPGSWNAHIITREPQLMSANTPMPHPNTAIGNLAVCVNSREQLNLVVRAHRATDRSSRGQRNSPVGLLLL